MVKSKDNCLLFACRVLRYARDSDHLVIRRSHWGWFPHFAALFELADGTICKMEYVPDAARPRWCPPLLFKGHVKKTYYKEMIDGDSSVRHGNGPETVPGGEEQGRYRQGDGQGQETGREITGAGHSSEGRAAWE